MTAVCLCDSPIRHPVYPYCGRCWTPQFVTAERTTNPPSVVAVPVMPAGEGRGAPSPADDLTEAFTSAFSDAELDRISAWMRAASEDARRDGYPSQ